jgi:hypothetical protein
VTQRREKLGGHSRWLFMQKLMTGRDLESTVLGNSQYPFRVLEGLRERLFYVYVVPRFQRLDRKRHMRSWRRTNVNDVDAFTCKKLSQRCELPGIGSNVAHGGERDL